MLALTRVHAKEFMKFLVARHADVRVESDSDLTSVAVSNYYDQNDNLVAKFIHGPGIHSYYVEGDLAHA
jgi:hypothetical protein